MVQRINFIEKGPYTLTYRNMLVLVGLMCVFCIAVHGIFMLRHALLKGSVSEMQRQVRELTVLKDKALATMQIAQTKQEGLAAPLAALFVKMPVWSFAFGDMAGRMPKQIWLGEMRTSNIGDRNDVRKLEIAGKGTSNTAIADFVKTLEDSDVFQNTVLANSKREASGYSFLITTEILFPKTEW